MFSIFNYRDIPTGEVEVVDPKTKKASGQYVTLAGPEHEMSRAMRFANERRTRAAMEKVGRITFGDPEADDDRATDEICAATLGWTLTDNVGKPIEFTAENVRKVYRDPNLQWFRKQMIEARTKTELFIAASATE